MRADQAGGAKPPAATGGWYRPMMARPTDDVYYPTLTPRLRLVTCGGAFDPVAHSYRSNVIVFAKLAG